MSDVATALLQLTGRPEPTADPALAAVKLARATIDALILRLGQTIDAKVTAQLAGGLTQLTVGSDSFVLKLETPLPVNTAVTLKIAAAPNGQPAVTVTVQQQPAPAQPAPPAPLPTQALQQPAASLLPTQAPPPVPSQPLVASLPPAPGAPVAQVPAPLQPMRGQVAAPPALPQASPPQPSSSPAAIPPAVASPPGAPAVAATRSAASAPAPQLVSAQPVALPQVNAPAPAAPAATTATPTPQSPTPPTPALTAATPAMVLVATPAAATQPTIPAATLQAQPTTTMPPVAAAPVAAPTANPASAAALPQPTSASPAAPPIAQPATPAPASALSAPTPAAPMATPASQPSTVPQTATPAMPAASSRPATQPPTSPPLTQILADPVQAAARQDSVLPLIARLATLSAPAIAGLPRPALEAIARVLTGRLDLNRAPPDGKSIRDAVLRAGIVTEPGARTPADAKSALLQLRSALSGFLGGEVEAIAPVTRRPPPPLKGEPIRAASPQQPGQPSDEPLETARQLLGHTDAALSRVKLLQLASNPTDAARPNTAAPAAEFRVEVPMQLGAETGILQLLVERDGKHKRTPAERGWRMRFALNFTTTGEVGAEVALLGRSANVALWAAEPATADALEAMLPELAPAVARHGLDVGSVRVRRGAPQPPARAPGQLLDSAR